MSFIKSFLGYILGFIFGFVVMYGLFVLFTELKVTHPIWACKRVGEEHIYFAFDLTSPSYKITVEGIRGVDLFSGQERFISDTSKWKCSLWTQEDLTRFKTTRKWPE